ncbi:MAG: hypothetical protein C0402_12945, partial [Thermodesulfovibrio sp.]|nr:hypothetical protein [Thermodesulfovibrio sp.]
MGNMIDWRAHYFIALLILILIISYGDSADGAALSGSLPYRHLNYATREPSAGPAIRPAYKGGSTKAVTPEDTRDINEAQVSAGIAARAEALTWSPVLMYEYVMNNIETEWYWG